MSQTVITSAFEQLKAQQAVSGEAVTLDEFVFANVPDLDADAPIDRNEGLPDDAFIVHRQAVSRTGVVNENAVVYSVVLGADVGDFSFNWIGLTNKAGSVLAMIVHAPEQQKLKTSAGQQGNVLTRSFLMEFTGAQNETGITTPAETWQIDFTARMAGIDERQRAENTDVYGTAAFFGNGWKVRRDGAGYMLAAGLGYVYGLRAEIAEMPLNITSKPVRVWADACFTGTLTSEWRVNARCVVASDLANYVQDNVQHYVFAVAEINADGTVTDLRPKGSISEQVASRDYLRKDADLSDLSDKAKARASLELGGAALLEVGKAPGTVAAGDDVRITDAMQKAQNGADIPDKEKFAENIGLKVLAFLSGGKNALPYFTGENEAELTTLTALGRQIIEKENAKDVLNHIGAAALNSPALTGKPTAPTAEDGNSSLQLATTEYAIRAIANAINSLHLGSASTRSVGNASGEIPDMSFFPIKTGDAGWAKFPNGIILQWGKITGFGAGMVDVYYPISFPSKVLFTGKYTFSGATSPTSSSLLEIINPTLSGFTLANIGTVTSGYQYIAPAIYTGAMFLSVGY